MELVARWISEYGESAITQIARPGLIRLGSGMPDLHLLTKGGSVSLLVRNGYVNPANRAEQYGTLRGQLTVSVNGTLAIEESLTIPDGTSVCYSQPGPMAALPGAAVDWLLRDCKGWPKTTMKAVREYFLEMNPYYGGKPGKRQQEPDVAGSPELTEYAWRGALGASFLRRYGLHTESVYADAIALCGKAATDRTRTALWVPVGYYDAQGQPVALSAMPDVLVGEKGLQKSGKATVVRPSESLYQFADAEHLTIDGEWTDAVLYGSPVARLWLLHVGEAICTWPMCRETSIHGNLRAYARVIKALALLVGLLPDRPQFATALGNAYAGLTSSLGTSPDGIPYANPSPAKGVSATYTHVCLAPWEVNGETGAALEAMKEARRAVIVPWVGAALTALGIARDIPAAKACCPNLALTVSHLATCLSHGTAEFIDNDGSAIAGEPWVDSYAMGVKARAKRANLPWKGTLDWCVPGAFVAGHKPPIAKMPDAKIGTLSAIEIFWPMLAQPVT